MKIKKLKKGEIELFVRRQHSNDVLSMIIPKQGVDELHQLQIKMNAKDECETIVRSIMLVQDFVDSLTYPRGD